MSVLHTLLNEGTLFFALSAKLRWWAPPHRFMLFVRVALMTSEKGTRREVFLFAIFVCFFLFSFFFSDWIRLTECALCIDDRTIHTDRNGPFTHFYICELPIYADKHNMLHPMSVEGKIFMQELFNTHSFYAYSIILKGIVQKLCLPFKK